MDKSIGAEIAVTPTFVDDNTVLLPVSASRSFVATNYVPSSTAPVRQMIRRVTTAIVADFDQRHFRDDGVAQMDKYFPELRTRITILRQLARTLEHNAFRKLLSREDVVAQQRHSRDDFTRRVANQLRQLLYF